MTPLVTSFIDSEQALTKDILDTVVENDLLDRGEDKPHVVPVDCTGHVGVDDSSEKKDIFQIPRVNSSLPILVQKLVLNKVFCIFFIADHSFVVFKGVFQVKKLNLFIKNVCFVEK